MLQFKTSKGTFTVQLFDKQAPITVENFLRYADEGFFDGTIFHRVIPGFMIQGGGLTADMKNKRGHDPIKNEATNGLKNKRGTLSMARTNDINSATSQFFVNVADNDFLDHKPGNYGYAVFGRIDSGIDVVDAIAGVKTGNKAGHQDVPVEPIVIESVTRVEKEKKE
jgi:cyclophilin family peptidyl-prolyl cis-trans isomerase